MFWVELTGDEFVQAVKQAEGVCLLPLSCVERHGHHLPLGTDMYIGREMCRRAAEVEAAIVFPDMVYTQILEAQHCIGTIAIDPELIVSLLNSVFREIARNGLKKIILVNAHGGNNALMSFLAQAQLRAESDFVVYAWNPILLAEDRDKIQALWETEVDGHAGEKETAAIMAIRPDLVRAEELRADGEGMPLGRLSTLRAAGLTPGIWWYADHPTHYRGDGVPATADKGERYLDAVTRSLAQAIRLVKQDMVAQQLQAEFFAAAKSHSG
jgi:creatinine amidohydrolase